ncbi:MAG: serine hydrolase domain-containing protein [Microthrixaceae bacterium]
MHRLIDYSGGLQVAEPGAVGVDQGRADELIGRAHREIEAGLLPSCQLALARNGRLVVSRTLGAAPESRYVMFSCTKILMAGALWLALGQGLVSRHSRAGDIVPEFATNGKEVVTVEQLLTHTAGFPSAPFAVADWEDRSRRLSRFSTWRLNWKPGSRFEYHPAAAHWVLAEILERVTGSDYRRFIHERLVEPLGLTRLRLGVPEEAQADVVDLVPVGVPPTPEQTEAVTGIAGLDLGELAGIDEDHLLEFNGVDERRIAAPGGGAIGTAAELAMFLQAVMDNPGRAWDGEVLRAGTEEIACALPDPMVGVPANRTLGLLVAGDDGFSSMRGFGRTVSARAFGHMGAGGQVAWADPASGLSFVYLTNGLDRDPIRMGRRGSSLGNRAGVCAG